MNIAENDFNELIKYLVGVIVAQTKESTTNKNYMGMTSPCCNSPYQPYPPMYNTNNYMVPPPRIDNILSPKERKILSKDNSGFDTETLILSDKDVNKSLCNHIDPKKGIVAEHLEDGSYRCPICHETFKDINSIDSETLNKSIENVISTIQWIKIMNIHESIPKNNLKQYSMIIGLLTKLPLMLELTKKDFEEYSIERGVD